jgi:hypothetical protein
MGLLSVQDLRIHAYLHSIGDEDLWVPLVLDYIDSTHFLSNSDLIWYISSKFSQIQVKSSQIQIQLQSNPNLGFDWNWIWCIPNFFVYRLEGVTAPAQSSALLSEIAVRTFFS